MKLKTSVAAVIVAFSATGAWAGPTGSDPAKGDLGMPDAAMIQPSAGAVNEELSWQFVNGEAAGTEDQDRADQSAKSEDQASGDQSATDEGKGESDQSAASDEPTDADQSASSEQEGGDDQTAKSAEQATDDQAAAPDDDGRSEQSAKTDDEGETGEAAAAEGDDASDQTANAEEQAGDDQSARSKEQQQGDQSVNSDQPAADLKDKVVVIIPRDWKGSIPDLIAALENSPDAKDIVIVQQGEPQAGNNEPDDSYSASNRPVINQQ